jgi:hypothetical protein
MRQQLKVMFLVVATVVGTQTATAASLATTSGRIGSGTAAVSACDANGFTFLPSVDSSGRITTVTTNSIDAACAGGTLRLTLTSGASNVGAGAVTLPSSGFAGTADVPISPQPLSSGVSAVYAVVEGP